MDIHGNHSYKAEMASVFEMFADADTVCAKHEALGSRKIEVSIERDDFSVDVHIEREVAAPDEIPGFVKKFVGEWNKTVQKEKWLLKDDGWHCRISVQVEGVPVEIKGKMVLSPTDSGCQNVVYIQASCGIPLIGGKIAQFIGGDIESKMQQEYEHIKQTVEA